jgi:hypothetical protein
MTIKVFGLTRESLSQISIKITHHSNLIVESIDLLLNNNINKLN